MKKVLLLIAMMAFVATGFAQKKVLVLTYSASGTTTAVAEQLKQQLSDGYGKDGQTAMIFSEIIRLEDPYPADFGQTVQRTQRERQSGEQPKLKEVRTSLFDQAEIIFLGYPIWSGTYASPIAALVKMYDFAGKTIVPFCTFGSGGLETSVADLRRALPKAKVNDGFGARADRVKADTQGKVNPVWKELNRFLIENGYMPGKVEPLPAYSAQKPVTDEEKALFDAACSSYQFPLGTPETCGKRETAESTDYEFKVKSGGFGGGPSTSTIYVTVPKEEGAKPVFTRVVR